MRNVWDFREIGLSLYVALPAIIPHGRGEGERFIHGGMLNLMADADIYRAAFVVF